MASPLMGSWSRGCTLAPWSRHHFTSSISVTTSHMNGSLLVPQSRRALVSQPCAKRSERVGVDAPLASDGCCGLMSTPRAMRLCRMAGALCWVADVRASS
jgi:hypothetical protein